MPGFFPSHTCSSKQVESTSNNQSQFSNTTYRGAARSRGAFLCSLTKSKRKIKSVAALLFLFLKPYFIITFFFAFRVFTVVLPACFFTGKPSSRHFLCCRMVPEMADVALKKVHFFMIILYQAKHRQHY